jgi:hypothetical protein
MLCGLRPNSALGCPLAIGREPNIPPFWVREAPSSKTWLKTLCQHDNKLPTTGTRPWILLTRRWLHRRISDHGPASQPVHRWIRDIEWARSDEKASTLSMTSYVRNGFVRGRQYYLQFSPYDLVHQVGLLSLMRLRTGSFLTAQIMAQMRLISSEFLFLCPF